MPLLALPRHRSFFSEMLYILLKVGLAVTLMLVVRATDSPLPAVVIVLLSKWRIFAVRPRFWLPNIKSNLVDITVGLSAVAGLGAAGGSLIVQLLITISYVVWLLVIKPRSKQVFVTIQAAAAIFFGVSAVMQVSFDWPSSVVVGLTGLIGYGAARHLLTHYREKNRELLAMAWGFVMAELGWLFYHWSFAYDVPGMGNIKLSQAGLIVLCLSFLADRAYASYHRGEGTLRIGDLIMPGVFSVSVILLLLFMFNRVASNLS